MIRIHKTEKPLRTGSIKLLKAEKNFLAYARFQGGEQIVVVLNNSKELMQNVTIPVWYAGVPKEGRMKQLIYSYEEGYTLDYSEYIVEYGEIILNIGRHSVIVLKPAENTDPFAG